MTEKQNETNPAYVPASEPGPAPEPAPTGAPVAHGRRRTTLVAGAVGAAVLVAGGIGAAFAIAGADRTASTALWAPDGQEPEMGEKPAPVPPNAIKDMLLPVPDDYQLGPDIGSGGNDYFLSGDKMAETLAEGQDGGAGRADALAGLKLQGAAGRSYGRYRGMVIEVQVMRAAPGAVGLLAHFSKETIETDADGRPGPTVDGYPDAKCVLSAAGEAGAKKEGKERKESIDVLTCVAVEGDVMVDFRAYAPTPFDTSAATGFLKKQLSHLKTPGESA